MLKGWCTGPWYDANVAPGVRKMNHTLKEEEHTQGNYTSVSTDGDAESTESEQPARGQWANKWEFLLSVLGFAVGLGNVWRFPYLCYKNGGGAFLVPYLLCLLMGGVPVLFLEIALGQYTSRGGLQCWNIVPIFKGIGYGTLVICFLLNIYYIVVLAWDVYYMTFSFTSVLPWSHCNNSWNTPSCAVTRRVNQSLIGNSSSDYTTVVSNMSSNVSVNGTEYNDMKTVDPVIEFWERQILQISPGIDRPDGVVWQLALALLVMWVICYFCIWKGVRWTGKVVYVTATFPYLMLAVLLVRGVTLPGAKDGILFFIKPDFNRLSDGQVWTDAGTQIFFSYAIALGAMPALGSYNKFNNDCYKHCVIVSVMNSFTSLLAGFVVFSLLGFMAREQGVPIDTVAESGPGLAFIAYPKVVTLMPAAPLWAVLFFAMVVMVGLDSQFVAVEAFSTMVVDAFPFLLRGWNREIFLAIYCGVSYLIGLSMVTRGGMYIFQLFDYYAASGMSLLWICFFECIALGWVFGVGKFYDAIELMIGYKIGPWMKVCWKVLTPLVVLGVFLSIVIQFSPLTYNRKYTYPMVAQGLGMCMAFSSMICVPSYFFLKLAVTPGSIKERWKRLTAPKIPMARMPKHWPEVMRMQEQKIPLSS